MKKIVMLVGYYPINRGGAELQSFYLANRLKDRYEVVFISPGQQHEGVFEEAGFKIYTLRNPSPFGIKIGIFQLRKKILSILKSERPDIIYQRVAHIGTGTAAQYCKYAECKSIWHIALSEDAVPLKLTLKSLVKLKHVERQFVEYGIRNITHVIGQANYQNELLNRYYGRECDAIIPNFHPSPKEEVIKQPPFTVAWIANIKEQKQPEKFVELACHFKDDKNVRFVMAGRQNDNEFSAYLESQKIESSTLEYLGELTPDEVCQLLESSHVFVNTSLAGGEGFPNTFIQAWMRRVPVVSLNVDPDNVLTNCNVGFCSGSIEKMIQDIQSLIDSPTQRESMAVNAQRHSHANHSMKNIEKVIELMEK